MFKQVDKLLAGLFELFLHLIIFFSAIFPYLRQNFQRMEKKSSALNWILFFVSVAAFVLLYISPYANYITVTLPFIVYYLAKALDLI